MSFSAFEPWSVFAIAFGASLFVALFIKGLIWHQLSKWTSNGNTWGLGLLTALNTPAKCIVFGLTLSLSNHFVPDDFKHQAFVALSLRVFFVLIGIWTVDRIAMVVLRSHPYFRSLAPGTMQLLLFALRIVVACLGLLVVLDNLGISITPLLASLGVGSVAVALALQDTLNNFFSGVYVLADQPIRINDYIRLEDGTEGTVTRIGWRSTQIRVPSNNYVVVPNTKIASAQLTNFNLPSETTSFSVDGRVSYACDLRHVEEVTLRVAKEILQSCPEAVAAFTPSVRFHTFAESSVNFSVSLQAKRYPDIGTIKHEFLKMLLAVYREEKIEIPYPHRVFVSNGRESSPTL